MTTRRARLKRLSRALLEAQKPIRVLDAVAWPDQIRRRFLSRRRPRSPAVTYAPLRFDAEAKDAEFAAIERRADPGDPIQAILLDTAANYRQVIAMLRARGTPDFLRQSRRLYGGVNDLFVDGQTTNLTLAQHLHEVLDASTDNWGGQEETIDEQAACLELRRRFDGFFGPDVVSVEVSTRITADAAAGASRLRLRRGARFDRSRIAYLEQHEGYVHIATTLNGVAQPVLPIFGKAAPRVVKYNEGLAVFAEWASGTLTVSRLRQLAERVILTQIAADGGSFVDVFEHALAHGNDRESAYDQAHRVFRGGSPEGGSFFTKDTAYLDHFVRTFNFFRVALSLGHLADLHLLFAGKFALEDLPVLAQARRDGLLEPARYLPPWLARPSWLAAHLGLSLFLNRMSVATITEHYQHLLAMCPLPSSQPKGDPDAR